LPAQLTWNNAGASGDGATWDTAINQNWNNGTQAATFSAGSDVIFNDSNNGHYAVTLNSTVSPDFVYVDNNSGNYIISGTGSITGSGNLDKNGSGTLTLATTNSYTGGTAVDGGVLVVAAHNALPANQALEIHNGTTVKLAPNIGTVTLSSLYMSDETTFDIGNNNVIINYGSGPDPIATIEASIASGYNNGTWTGFGIISSAAQVNGLSYGIGWADGADEINGHSIVAGLSSGQIEIKYTLLGDANLDGVVNGSDFSILAANFGQGYSNWDQGNFLFTPAVNGTDFAALAGNFGQGDSGADGAVTAADREALDAFAAANGLLADVPEPGTLAIFGLTTGILGFRRRKRREL
jgi:autotransporter-associated beta strand protein